MRAALLIFLFAASMAGAWMPPPYPRVATVNYGGQQNYDNAAFQAALAKFSLTIWVVYPGWVGGGAMTMDQSVRAVKAINPQELVFLYIINNEVASTGAAMAPLRTKINAERWWLYPSGITGTPVPSAWAGTTEVNNTNFPHPDSNGDTWVTWYAKWAVQTYYGPSPNIDGFFTDNVFYKPFVTGDWSLVGRSDVPATAAPWVQAGYATHFSTLNQLMPGKYQIGNAADWGTPGANISAITGILNGAFIEGLIGYSYSAETWGSWSEMMREYRVVLAATIAPQLVIFGQAGSPTDYRSMRYGLASCLMDNGYFQFSQAGREYTGTFWYDEYGANLGAATSSPSLSPWQNGVFRRDYANGIALVNPRGNGAQTVTLEMPYRKIQGIQDPVTNNGQVVTSVTLTDRDGIILLRTQSSATPKSPTSVMVH